MQDSNYAVKALHAEFQAEQASTPALADAWRHIADTYRVLDAHQKWVEGPRHA